MTRPAVSPEQARQLVVWARRFAPVVNPPAPVIRLATTALRLSLGVEERDARTIAPAAIACGLISYRPRPFGRYELHVPCGKGKCWVDADDLAAMEQNGKGGSHP